MRKPFLHVAATPLSLAALPCFGAGIDNIRFEQTELNGSPC
jgi:hypothetical protein